MKKRLFRILILFAAAALQAGCGQEIQGITETEAVMNHSVISQEKETLEEQEIMTESVSETVIPDYSGDGWYITDGTLYISKIYYRIINLSGKYKCLYESPWTNHAKEIINVVIDGEMVYKKESEITGNTADDCYVVGNAFDGGGPLLAGMPGVKSVVVKKLDLDMISDIAYMFAGMAELSYLDLAGLDTAGVTDASYLLYGNEALTSVDLEQLNTSSFENISHIFAGCSNLQSISVSSWDTGNVKDFSNAFSNCTSLGHVDLSGWAVIEANVAGMFAGCENLTGIDLSKVSLQDTISANSMFDGRNKIMAYRFANPWNIKAEKSKQIWVIGEDCYDMQIAYEPYSGACMVAIYYKYYMPDWYKTAVEYRQNVDEFIQIQSSDYLDVYVSKVEGEISAPDVIAFIIDALVEMDKIDEDEGTLVNNLVSKLQMLLNWRKGEYSLEDVKDLLDMTEEELEILIDDQSETAD